MKGSVFVLLGCCGLFFAAPSLSYSVSGDDQLANRRDARAGSTWTDAATSGDARGEKSEIRKRDTRSLVGDLMESDEKTIPLMPPIDKESALYLFKLLGKHGGKCFEQVYNYILKYEMPVGSVESWYLEASFTRSDMIKWLKIVKDSVSKCLMNYVEQLNEEPLWRDDDVPDTFDRPPNSETFANVPEFMSPLADVGKKLKKCLEDAIRYLEAKSRGPDGTVQRSSESPLDLLTEVIGILSLIDGRDVPAGDTAPIFPPGHTVVPVITTYKKRNSLDKPRGYRHYSNLPGFVLPRYVYTKDIPNSIVPESSGYRGEAVQIPYTPGITTHRDDVNALPTQQLSLLNIVLDKIYSKLQGEVSPDVNMEAAPVEGLRVDANGALGLYPGSGEGPAMGNPECVRKRAR